MLYCINQEKNGVEIYFENKPAQEVIANLKSNKFKWNGKKKCWYTRQTEASIEFAQKICDGNLGTVTEDAGRSKAVKYYNNVSDYITIEEFESKIIEYYDSDYYINDEWYKIHRDEVIQESLRNYNTELKYNNISQTIREAIIGKSLGFEKKCFDYKIYAVWDKLPTIEGLKAGKVYSAMWGYGQTQITTATHYGKAFGLDVLVTGSFGGRNILLKRIRQDGTFKDGCMYFSENTYSDEEIQEINTKAIYSGH